MIDRIYRFAGGMPFYIQAIGNEIIEQNNSTGYQGKKLL